MTTQVMAANRDLVEDRCMSNDITAATTTVADSATIEAAIDGYFTCWNTLDAAERAAAVHEHWTPDARMSDPLLDVRGHDELIGVFGHFHDAYPGCSFRRTGGHDAHHDLVRWGWEMVGPDGATMLDGLDVAVITRDGKLHAVAGFFGASIPT